MSATQMSQYDSVLPPVDFGEIIDFLEGQVDHVTFIFLAKGIGEDGYDITMMRPNIAEALTLPLQSRHGDYYLPEKDDSDTAGKKARQRVVEVVQTFVGKLRQREDIKFALCWMVLGECQPHFDASIDYTEDQVFGEVAEFLIEEVPVALYGPQ